MTGCQPLKVCNFIDLPTKKCIRPTSACSGGAPRSPGPLRRKPSPLPVEEKVLGCVYLSSKLEEDTPPFLLTPNEVSSPVRGCCFTPLPRAGVRFSSSLFVTSTSGRRRAGWHPGTHAPARSSEVLFRDLAFTECAEPAAQRLTSWIMFIPSSLPGNQLVSSCPRQSEINSKCRKRKKKMKRLNPFFIRSRK